MLTCHGQVEGCLLPAYGVADYAGVGAAIRLLCIPYLQLGGLPSELEALFGRKGMSILLPGDISHRSFWQHAGQVDE